MQLYPPGVLERLVDSYHRPAGLLAQDVLDPGRYTRPARRTETRLDTASIPGFYPCNQKGQPLMVLPTLVSYPGSHAYRSLDRDGLLVLSPGEAGSLTGGADPLTGGADPLAGGAAAILMAEPSAAERERCLGMLPGSTEAPGLNEADRCALLGRPKTRFRTLGTSAAPGARPHAPLSLLPAASHLAAGSQLHRL